MKTLLERAASCPHCFAKTSWRSTEDVGNNDQGRPGSQLSFAWWRKDWVKVSSELTQDRRDWGASIWDVVNSIGDAESRSRTEEPNYNLVYKSLMLWLSRPGCVEKHYNPFELIWQLSGELSCLLRGEVNCVFTLGGKSYCWMLHKLQLWLSSWVRWKQYW